MIDSLHYGRKRDGITIPNIAVAIVLSILVHIAALWRLPQVRLTSPSSEERGGPLTVELARPPAPPAVRSRPPSEAQPPARPRAAQPQARPRAPVPPPAVVQKQPAPPILQARPETPSVPVPSRPAPARPAPAPSTDLAAYVEAQRRARGESAPSPPAAQSAPSAAAEDENARANRLAAANLGANRRPSFGPDRRKGGGLFDLTRLGYDTAEFMFYGWNKDIQRETAQTIEVRKGANADIRIAVVRKMIGIIREHEQEDFIWESQRLNRSVTLSARMRDNAGLEEFLMQEFFEDPGRPAFRR